MQCENLRVLRIHRCAFPFVDHLTNLASLACRSNPQGAKQHLALLLPLPKSATLDTSSFSIPSAPAFDLIGNLPPLLSCPRLQ